MKKGKYCHRHFRCHLHFHSQECQPTLCLKTLVLSSSLSFTGVPAYPVSSGAGIVIFIVIHRSASLPCVLRRWYCHPHCHSQECQPTLCLKTLVIIHSQEDQPTLCLKTLGEPDSESTNYLKLNQYTQLFIHRRTSLPCVLRRWENKTQNQQIISNWTNIHIIKPIYNSSDKKCCQNLYCFYNFYQNQIIWNCKLN
jgi:hypothetical protein